MVWHGMHRADEYEPISFELYIENTNTCVVLRYRCHRISMVVFVFRAENPVLTPTHMQQAQQHDGNKPSCVPCAFVRILSVYALHIHTNEHIDDGLQVFE